MISKKLLQKSSVLVKFGLKTLTVASFSLFAILLSVVIGIIVSAVPAENQNYTISSFPTFEAEPLDYLMVKQNPISFGYTGKIKRVFPNPLNDRFVILCGFESYIFVSQSRGFNGRYISLPEPIEYVIYPTTVSAILISNKTSYITNDFGETFSNYSISFTSVNFTNYFYDATFDNQNIYFTKETNKVCWKNIYANRNEDCAESCSEIFKITLVDEQLSVFNESCVCRYNSNECVYNFANSTSSLKVKLATKTTNDFFIFVTKDPCAVYQTKTNFNRLNQIIINDLNCESIVDIQGNATTSFYIYNTTDVLFFASGNLNNVYNRNTENTLSAFKDFMSNIVSFTSINGTAFVSDENGVYLLSRLRITALQSGNFFTPSFVRSYTSFFNTGYNLEYFVSSVNHVGNNYYFYYSPNQNANHKGLYTNNQFLNYIFVSNGESFDKMPSNANYIYDNNRTYIYDLTNTSDQYYTDNFQTYVQSQFSPTNESLVNDSVQFFSLPAEESFDTTFLIVKGASYSKFIFNKKGRNPDDEFDDNFYNTYPQLYYYSSVNYSLTPKFLIENVTNFVRVNDSVYASTSDNLIYRFDDGDSTLLLNFSKDSVDRLIGGDHLLIILSNSTTFYYYDSDLQDSKTLLISSSIFSQYNNITISNGSIILVFGIPSNSITFYNIEFDKYYTINDSASFDRIFFTNNKILLRKTNSGNVTISEYRYVPYSFAKRYIDLAKSDNYFNNETTIIEPSNSI